MQTGKLSRFPFYIFLLPVFFIWHVANCYFGLIPWKYIVQFLLMYLGLSLLLFFIGKLLLRNNSKAGCWAFALLAVFFFWGSIHDFLKSAGAPAFLYSYKFLLSLFLILIIINTIWLKRKPAPLKLNRFLLLLFGLFVTGEAAISIYKLSSSQYKKNDLTYYNEPLPATRVFADPALKPDIFVFVLDEYASTRALQQNLHYDNSQFDSMLTNCHFYVAQGSKSNYNYTPLSIGSMLNLRYFNIPLEQKKAKPSLILQGEYTVKKNVLAELMIKEGYTVINLGYCDIANVPPPAGSIFTGNAIEVMYLETLWGRVEREIWWYATKNANIDWVFMKAGRQVDVLKTNRSNLQQAMSELSKESDKPRFVFVHLMQPHMPYFYDRNGNLRNKPFEDKPEHMDSLYIDQLMYTNSLMEQVAKTTETTRTRPRVIIIEGDHGYRDKQNNPAKRNKQFMNLNAYYFSDGDHSQLYDSISSVNSFRVILNKYFRTDLPLLKDSTIRLIE